MASLEHSCKKQLQGVGTKMMAGSFMILGNGIAEEFSWSALNTQH